MNSDYITWAAIAGVAIMYMKSQSKMADYVESPEPYTGLGLTRYRHDGTQPTSWRVWGLDTRTSDPVVQELLSAI